MRRGVRMFGEREGAHARHLSGGAHRQRGSVVDTAELEAVVLPAAVDVADSSSQWDIGWMVKIALDSPINSSGRITQSAGKILSLVIRG